MRKYLCLAALALPLISVGAEKCCKVTNAPPAIKAALTAPLPDHSLFHLEGNWTTHGGDAVALNHFTGKPTLVTMFFASCAVACPILIEDIRGVQKELPEAQRDQLNIVMLSFDTERDTPEALAAFAKARSLSSPPWTLMHGDADVVLETAALLNVRYRKDDQGNFAHSNIMTLLNAEGEVVYQLDGLRADPAPLLKAISSLSEK